MFAVPLRRLRSLALLSISFVIPSLPPAFAQSPPAKTVTAPAKAVSASPDVDFDHDPRFDRLVTLDRTGISVEDLLLSLEQRDLFFTCGRSCADIKLQIRIKNRSMRSLLQAVTELLPGVWHVNKDKRTFSLSMTDAALTRRETWWGLVEGEQERARAALRAQVLATMRDPKPSAQPGPLAPGQDEAAYHRANAESSAEEAFFKVLPPDLQQSIADRLIEMGTPGYAGGIESGGVSVRIGALPETAKEQIRGTRLRNAWKEIPDFDNATFRFSNVGMGVGVSLIFTDGNETMSPFFLFVNPPPNALPPGLEHDRLPALVQKMGKAAPDAWRRLAAYQQSRVWKNDPPAVKRKTGSALPWRADVLRWIADTTGAEFVADAPPMWYRTMSPEEKAQKVTSLAEELNQLTVWHELSWKPFGDNLYLVRNNRWYRDDAAEIPSRLLRNWSARLKADTNPIRPGKAGEPTPATPEQIKSQMDWEAEIAGLTTWQIGHGLMWYIEDVPPEKSSEAGKAGSAPMRPGRFSEPTYPFASTCERLLRERDLARFYGALPDAAQRALCEGRLPMTALSPAQQSQVFYLMSRSPNAAEQPAFLLGIQPKRGPFGRSALSRSTLKNPRPDMHLVIVPPPSELARP